MVNRVLVVVGSMAAGWMLVLYFAWPGQSAHMFQPIDPAKQRLWASPLSGPGLHNFNQVSQTLFRGAQPSAQGMQTLKDMGVKTIVNLRAFHSDRGEIGTLDLGYEHLWFRTWHAENEDIVRFLKIVNDPARQPVYVHCLHGSDRTGTMCAIYRICAQGWDKEDAIDEMTRGTYGFHSVFQHLPRFIRSLDVERIRKEAGISAPAKILEADQPRK